MTNNPKVPDNTSVVWGGKDPDTGESFGAASTAGFMRNIYRRQFPDKTDAEIEALLWEMVVPKGEA
jgi:hypothetical protein